MHTIAIADDDSLVGHLAPARCDLLLCLGDLWDASIEKAYARYTPGKAFGIRGNHDTDAPFPFYVTPLHFTIEEYGGLKFGGFNGSWRYKPKGHHLYEQEEVCRMLRHFPRVDVFVAHNSPRGIHERGGDTHQGFDGFLSYIETAKPRYFIHGHQHLSAITRIGETEVIGVFGEATLNIKT
jgi:Icc-related predicted phosphoesterase